MMELRFWQRRTALRRAAIVCCLILILLLPLISGCITAFPSAANPTNPNQPAQKDNTQTGAQAPAQGKLRLYGTEPDTLDIASVGDIASYQYISQIFSGLVTLDDKMQVVPDIAKSWDVSPDGKTYVFHLRQDVKFHNGHPLTADAFKYSIERSADPATKSPVASLYLGDIVGVMDKLSGQAREVSGVRVKDPYTLEIEIDAPKTFFLAKLTYPTSYALEKNSVEGDKDWAKHPNGTGPFKLKSWKTDDSIVLQRNDFYYGQKPSVAEVDFYLGGGSPMTMYESRELDAAPVGIADIDRVLDRRSSLNQELTVVPQLSLSYVAFNTQMKPFDDVNVRQAFAYATDKDKLSNILFKKTRAKANGILPPGMPGYNDGLQGLPFDPEKAKELLASSSYGSAANLPEITITVSNGAGQFAQSLAAMYKRNLGVDINVVQVDQAFQSELKDHKYQMFETGWIADYPDPQDFLDLLFESHSDGNYSGFADANVDQMLAAARIEPDLATRMKIYQDVEQQIVQQAPVIPLFHDVDYTLVKPYVSGFVESPLGITLLRNIQVGRQGQ